MPAIAELCPCPCPCSQPSIPRLHPCTAYLVVADEAYGRAIPSAFLDKMASEFAMKFADKAAGAKEGGLNGSFG